MRKTKCCTATKMETYPLRIRKCSEPRNHPGLHQDEEGEWE